MSNSISVGSTPETIEPVGFANVHAGIAESPYQPARDNNVFLITGATGLVGRGVLRKLLDAEPASRAYVIVRDELRWRSTAHSEFGHLASRIIPVHGDLTARGLGLEYNERRRLTREVTGVIHAAADICFSKSLPEARLVNTEGTRELLALARVCGKSRRFVYVSTAYVAGRNCGLIRERDNGSAAGWVNSYERSKYEAEALVRKSDFDWMILRPSTIACDSRDGTVTQINAVHKALRIYNRGLASMMPASPSDDLDMVPADYVNGAIARLAFDPRASKRTVHLCAGKGAMTIGNLLDSAYELWEMDPDWKKKGVARVAMTDLETYDLFARSVIETGDQRLASILSSMSHFIPQLAMSKQFDTTVADALLGAPAPAVSTYWKQMVTHLMATSWRCGTEAAA
jgi:thioester reductase-like protein